MIQQRHPRPEPQPPQESVSLNFKMFPEKKKPAPPPPQFDYLPTMRMAPPFPGQAMYTQPNVLNQINIGAPDPTSRHNQINAVYEDVLPLRDAPTSQNTISERLSLNSFIRSVVLEGTDGNVIYFKKGKLIYLIVLRLQSLTHIIMVD